MDFTDWLLASFDRRVEEIEKYDFGGNANEVIREVTRIWEAEVAKTYNTRESMGLSSSHQLRKCLRGKYHKASGGNKIYFWMEPIYHNYHSTKWGTYVTAEYGRFIKEGIKPSSAGRYDPCVDRKLDIMKGGTHPGVPKTKYWDPMMRRIRERSIKFIRQRYIGKFKQGIKKRKSGTKKTKLFVRIGGGGMK